MDEVHYLADRERGPVWEEVIINLPEHVSVVALSATVSNAEEFGAWLAEVRGDTDIVVEEHRPVPLWQHVIADGSLHDLFVDERGRAVNPELVRLARDDQRIDKARRDYRGGWGQDRRAQPPGPGQAAARGPPAAPASGNPAPRRHPGPAARGPAALHQLHLQPRGLRGGGGAVPARRPAADHPGRAPGDPGAGPGEVRGPAALGPRGPGLRRLARRARARDRRPPCRAHPHVQGGGRGAVPGGAGQGGVRHRDPGPGHQHARPRRGPRAAGEVERRDARTDHAGGVHPADRAGRAPRHRRRGACGRRLAPGDRPGGARRPGLHPHLPAHLELPAQLQHGREPRRTGSGSPQPGRSWSPRSPSSRRIGASSGWPARSSATRRPSPATRSR